MTRLVLIAATALFIATAAASGENLSVRFDAWRSAFSKQYESDAAAKQAFEAFQANDAIIEEHNQKNLSYTLGHNEFSDLTWEQFKAKYVGKFSDNPTLHRERNFDYSLLNETITADAIDWVSKGAVTPVKNQGQCGSCWSFSTTGAVEGAFQVAGNTLTSLSEQQLVACDKVDNGCNGGLMDNAFKWIGSNGGLCTEDSYPYTAGKGTRGSCQSSCTKVVTVTGHTDVPGESGMVPALQKGPVSVAIEADKSAFQLYKSGVLDNAACGKKLDHGVLAVGFGTDSGKDYYKVKNSWGSSWGESGYIRMVRDKDQCGIADSASYPTGAKKVAPGPGPGPGPGPAPSAGCSDCLSQSKVWCYKDSKCHDVGSLLDPCTSDQCCSSATFSSCKCKSCSDSSCHA